MDTRFSTSRGLPASRYIQLSRIIIGCSVMMTCGSVLAADGTRPIFQATTITESGSYVLNRAITVATPPGIVVDAPQVTIDLNGKSIRTAPYAGANPVISVTSNVRFLTIKNGVLIGGGTAIGGGGPDLVVKINRVTTSASNSGIALSAAACEISEAVLTSARTSLSVGAVSISVRDSIFRNAPTVPNACCCGVALGAFSTAAFRNNTIDCRAYQGSALSLSNAGAKATAIVDGNAIFGDDATTGIVIQGDGYTVSHNTITGFRVAAIDVGGNGNSLFDNRISDADGPGAGISVGGSYNLFRDNLVKHYRIGLYVGGSRNRFDRNQVSDSWEYGFLVAGAFNALTDNQVQGQSPGSTIGLWLDSGSQSTVYRDNILLGNETSVLDDGSGNVDAGGNIQ